MASFLGDLVSRALGSPLANCCFTLGEKLGEDSGTLWMRHKGTKKDDGSPLTVFFFDGGTYSVQIMVSSFVGMCFTEIWRHQI